VIGKGFNVFFSLEIGLQIGPAASLFWFKQDEISRINF